MKAKACFNSWSSLALASTLTGMISLSATAQTEPESHSRRNLPYPLVRNPEPRRYNLKWRHLMARFQASVSAEISDNIDLAGRNPEADVSFGPNIGVGLFWPITQVNMLQYLDQGFDVNARSVDNYKETLLMRAVRLRATETVKLLLDRGAKADERTSGFRKTALFLAAYDGSEQIAKLLLKTPTELHLLLLPRKHE